MKRTPYTIDAVVERINEVEKNHRAFLLSKTSVESAVTRYRENFGRLPKRLQTGTITVSSGENLPNAYRSFRVNNTIVTLSVKNGEIYLHTVERKEVFKNWFPKEISFQPEYIPEIKDKIFENMVK